MSKKLAIKGHKTRGKEVIELLEMMGGHNVCNLDGKYSILWISNRNNYICNKLLEFEPTPNFEIFTLEEFLKKFPFKVGDVIRFPYNDMVEEIAEMEWDEELEDIIYTSVSGTKRPCSVPKNTNNETNVKTDCKKCCIHYGSTQCFDKDCPNNTFKDMEENKLDLTLKGELYHGNRISYQIPDDYEVSKIENGEIILQKKKPKYPTTYDDCCRLLNVNEFDGYELMANFSKLINARNAYWKIAGEEMGLGKPWEPDFSNRGDFYVIITIRNEIRKEWTCGSNAILAFPTEEMRDTFYENFKDLIEKCKELL